MRAGLEKSWQRIKEVRNCIYFIILIVGIHYGIGAVVKVNWGWMHTLPQYTTLMGIFLMFITFIASALIMLIIIIIATYPFIPKTYMIDSKAK